MIIDDRCYDYSTVKTLDGANSSVLHTRFKLCKKLISLKNLVATWAIWVKGGHCIDVDDFSLPKILAITGPNPNPNPRVVGKMWNCGMRKVKCRIENAE